MDQILKNISTLSKARNIPREAIPDLLNIIYDAMNSTVGGLIIADLQGKIKFVNEAFCRMFEYNADEVLDIEVVELFPTQEITGLSDAISIIEVSDANTLEFTVQKNDGTCFIVEMAASNVRSQSGQIVARMASFVDITERKKIEIDREILIKKLQDALDKIKILKGILPICASCRKIRDDKGNWKQIDQYVSEHSDVKFSHGFCTECAKKLYPNVAVDNPDQF